MDKVVNDFSIIVGTKNGSGSSTANNTILRAIFKMGIPVSGKNLFPSNIQGLPTWFEVRVSVGHINHMLREVALSRVTGRPRKRREPKSGAAGPPAQANAGLFFPGGGAASPGGDGGA